MPVRKQVVPKITFAKMLERALSPPDESMVLPYSKCVSVCLPMWIRWEGEQRDSGEGGQMLSQTVSRAGQ